ncbi:DNA-binding transcriptional ArsR family regulator [Spinactinospora alkalitolerans]|uniref:DNA-binding transcriptional ArsR family regulator n=1 Tax=Spinactinospora alkalitolerans TaxID=687207 RepID=A0A852U155_9ACTN|nr:metalloregulator ArsR/SmtB family transcription factor [Spinactinospora alkalitolerans]NYE50576.1 DNA-binding transcriptional ArsR family regulator [Spinactinospora alkalitolerans]
MSRNKAYEALAHPSRRAVLRILRDRDHVTAGQMASELQLAKPTLSGHLNVLKAADIVIGEREGTSIHYRINTTVLEDVLDALLSLVRAGADTRQNRDE